MATFRYKQGDEVLEAEYSWEPESRVLTLRGKSYPCDANSVVIEGRRVPFWTHAVDGLAQVWLDGVIYQFSVDDPRQRDTSQGHSGPVGGAVKAQMPGKILKVSVATGDRVTVGQNLLLMESMKMELAFDAPVSGVVKRVEVMAEQMVSQGQLLLEIVEDSSGS